MLKGLIFALTLIVIPIGTFMGAAYFQDYRLKKFFNDGICKKCGGKQTYDFLGMGFYVRCMKCGNHS